MNSIIPRTCIDISTRDVNQNREKNPQSLEAFRNVPAYVLLGDPGAGKTTAFKSECEALEENACLISARNFLALNMGSHPEWRDKTLFIDGLDEIRAGASDARTPFDQIRRRIDELGRPHFRLSCRDADWLGDNDRGHLASVSQDSQVKVLRLNLLTGLDVIQILGDHPGIGDPQAFIKEARERGVDGLLVNPQNLTMLADVVAQDGGWPKSRLETFEKACSQIVREHNEEHQHGEQPSAPDLLKAAGRLCAVQLFSGTAGYSLRHNEADDDYPALDSCNYDSPKMLRSALSTKLFKGATNNHRAPVHRHIAEFLGARHLSQLIKDGLPVRRVFALMTGEDGIVVTGMRGLSAWLAAHCKNAREDLIDRDPIGVGLYGDIGEFSLNEKRVLLKALNREASRLGSVRRLAAACGALATPDMEPVLKEILEHRDPVRDHQIFTAFVLCILTQGSPLPDLSEILLETVRDDTQWIHINSLALDAFIRCHPSRNMTSKLKALLADVHAGDISDPDNELLGALLAHLYPQEVPPSEVWNYFPAKWNPERIGRDYGFWCEALIRKSSREEVAELLDNLKERLPGLWPALEVRHWNDLPFKLLAYGLKAHGEELDTEALYDWLSIGLSGDDYENESIRDIRCWLEQHPDVQKAVIAEGLDRWYPESGVLYWDHAFNVEQCLYGSSLPPDFGLWCLNQAVARAGTEWRVSEYLLERAVRAHQNQSINKGLSLELLQERTQKNEGLKTTLARLLAPQEARPMHLEANRKSRKHIEERRRQEERWLDYARSQEAALRENRADPFLLNQLAKKYFGFDFSSDGPKAIAELLRGDTSLIQAALQGLRGTINRRDVPSMTEIIDISKKGREYYLGWPFLAGLEEIERTAPEDLSQWNDGRIRKALAFYYCTFHWEYQPKWYQQLLETRPEVVADVQVKFAVSEFRSDRDHIYKLWELAYDPYHARVARHASLPLLSAFPTRCKLKHIGELDHLLWAALRHADRALLQELIERKLSRSSMNVAQRVHWLAAGTILRPGTYEDHLKDLVQNHERRIPHLAAFFCSAGHAPFSSDGLENPVLELLIRLVGSCVGPDQRANTLGLVTSVMKPSDLVSSLIQSLAASSDKASGTILDTLCSDPALSRWHDQLSQAQDAHRVIWRDAGYCHLNIDQVCRTLNGGTPANAGDLAGLVKDWLCEISVQIRTGNTDDWRQYWNEETDKRRWKPKHEDACRNTLLLRLQERLPQGVDAQHEVQYARAKRADIRISCADFQVPVEAKRNNHRDLWSACKNQLIKQYTTDPATGGYGIYLVFWFGKEYTQAPPSGTRPVSPQVLQEQLKAALSEDEARKISVCIIDVSGDLLG